MFGQRKTFVETLIQTFPFLIAFALAGVISLSQFVGSPLAALGILAATIGLAFIIKSKPNSFVRKNFFVFGPTGLHRSAKREYIFGYSLVVVGVSACSLIIYGRIFADAI